MNNVGLFEIACRLFQSCSNQSWSLSSDLANANAPFRWVLSEKGFVYCFNSCLEILLSPNDLGKINLGEKFRYRYKTGNKGLFKILLNLIKSGSVLLLHSQELRMTKRFIFSGYCIAKFSPIAPPKS